MDHSTSSYRFIHQIESHVHINKISTIKNLGKFLVLMCLTVSSFALKFKEIKHPNGLLFIEQSNIKISHDHGSIDFIFDLTSIYNITSTIEDFLEQYEKQSKTVNTLWINYHTKNLRKQFNTLKVKQINLEIYQSSPISKRMKRFEPITTALIVVSCLALGATGGAFASAFVANKHAKNIEEIQSEIYELKNVTEKNAHMLQNFMVYHNNITNKLTNSMKQIQKKMDDYDSMKTLNDLNQLFGTTSNFISELIDEHSILINKVTNVLENAVIGKTTDLVSEEVLTEALVYIQNQLTPSQTLPIN